MVQSHDETVETPAPIDTQANGDSATDVSHDVPRDDQPGQTRCVGGDINSYRQTHSQNSNSEQNSESSRNRLSHVSPVRLEYDH